ncbi:restriction endonuclease subunit S [Vibrio harveyi]|uniref:restriction endonuclease subunit S n=1 Tax=Vibrio harveyi TaxID=669 RepID=UPI000680832C|nr:restriction endonuclease subunit S [Vibrio harveyi]PNM40982.1 restriction endonuclease subunit S [Vibrio harveyi]
MSLPLVALKDCCTVVGGATPKREVEAYWDNQDIPWVTPKDISKIKSIYFDDAPEYISQKGFDSCAVHKLPKGSLLLTSRAPIGNVAITTRELCTNQGFKSLVPNENVDIKYLYFCMLYSANRLDNEGNGATFKEVSKKVVEAFKIPLPPLDTQKQIAAVLEKADQLRKDCQQMEQELNSLAQSVFIDMFGDPVTNPKGWEVRAIGTTFDLLTDYHANGSYEVLQENVTLLNEGYALMVRTTDLEKNNFTDGVNYISEHAYEFLTKTKVFGNELIVNKIGSAGKVYLMPVLNRPVSLAMNQFMIRFNEELASSVFMYYLLTSKGGTQAIQKKVKGAVTKTIRKDALREIALPIPPKDKQDEFSQFIEQHKKLLDDNKSLKEEYEQSFNALMQKAFKGELNL